MLFTIPNKNRIDPVVLKTRAMLQAYSVIKHYPMNGAERLLDAYINNQYNKSLKNMCIDLLLHMTFHVNKAGEVILLFNDKRYDTIAQIITFGTGNIPGSKILQTAFYR